ncbi:MAG: molybdate ABC transporter substrate-binding protein [Chloroflexi bacterium RBG_16_54_11]|nr:MAG: molybdate ABC transporter substrate-binding protein [Chloroflexi bacterium RBG_16_54_11]
MLRSGVDTDAGRRDTLTIYAAASLTEAFSDLGMKFEATNPGVKVEFSFAGSQVLRTQLEQGAKADIFASADHVNMDWLVSEDLIEVDSYQDFVTNHLVAILPPENPGGVQGLGDLARPGLMVVLADKSVPAGNYARQVLANLSDDTALGADYAAEVLRNVVSYETDVRQVVTKVELGEADAGIVYASDAVAAIGLITLDIPDKYNVTAQYPIAILASSHNPELARAFIEYVTSPEGIAIMSRWGFSPEQKP